MANTERADIPRVATGIEGLDTILRGGLVLGGVYLLQGPPGVGKTTLASQLSFQHLRTGGQVVYTTMLSESHARLVLHLRGMSFFDPQAIGRSLHFLSGFQVLEEGGLGALLELLRREMRARKATLLVLDGLVALHESTGSERELKKFVHALQTHAELSGCTVLMLTTGLRSARAELTMVDGLLRLVYSPRGERFLQVRKLRGSAFLRGLHPFLISNDGLTFYPRTEVRYAHPSVEDRCREGRLSTGVPRLDEMLGGGLPCDTTTLLLGPSGSGKTTFGLHFLAESTVEEPGLQFGFYETPPRLKLKAKRLGIPLEELEQSGAVSLLWFPPTTNILDVLAQRLLHEVEARGVRRLFIDGLGGFLEAARRVGEERRISHFFTALANELRAREVTTLYSHETKNLLGGEVETPLDGVSTILENLVFLRFVERGSELYRLLSVLKVRDSDFDGSLREYRITARGVELEKDPSTARSILEGTIRAPATSPVGGPPRRSPGRGRRK